jgi:thiol-disulfide isomerase/thioredoxin
MNKTRIAWAIRILVFVLFVVSAVAKMFPIWAFEKQLVDLNVASWCSAPYFSRLLIGVELALGIAILQRHYLKRLVIPAIMALLVVFCIHLSIEMVKHGAMNGNCGCFGQLIPMTPLEAFIKNIVTLGLMAWLYRLTKESEKPHRFSWLLVIWGFSTLLMFVVFPFCPCKDDTAKAETISTPLIESNEEVQLPADSQGVSLSDTGSIVSGQIKKDSTAVANQGPRAVVSKFAPYAESGGKKVNVDEGKYLVCMFAAGCDHCQDAAKSITALSKQAGFPKVFIFFMDEETEKIPAFFTTAGKKYPYKVLDVPKFWTLFGNEGSTPGVFLQWNGNPITSFIGTDDKGFTAAKLKTELAKMK